MRDFYFDTSIWLDFYENRGKNGKLALKLINKIISNDLKIFYSDSNIKELRAIGYTSFQINEMFSFVKTNLSRLHTYAQDIKKANKIAKTRSLPKRDVLYAILAKNNNLNLISRDHHFQKLKDIAKAKLPENFI